MIAARRPEVLAATLNECVTKFTNKWECNGIYHQLIRRYYHPYIYMYIDPYMYKTEKKGTLRCSRGGQLETPPKLR
jgi:hypothetical protein